MPHPLSTFFNPRTAAVVGASPRPESRGFLLWRRALLAREAGGTQLWPVNPKHEEIGGETCFASLGELPSAPDLVVCALEPAKAEETLAACKDAGVRNVILIAPDPLADADLVAAGRAKALAREYGIALMGPAAGGLMRPASRFNASLLPQLAPAGSAALVCRSAALASRLIAEQRSRGCGFSAVLLPGLADGPCDARALSFLAEDPATRVIAVVAESAPEEPGEWFSALRLAARRKPVVVLRNFAQAASQRLCAVRMGSAADNAELFCATARAQGAVVCRTLTDFSLALAAFCSGKSIRQGRVAVISNCPSLAALASDAMLAAGLAPASLADETVQRITPEAELRQCLDPAVLAQQADVLAASAAFSALLHDPGVDAVAAWFDTTPQLDADALASSIAAIASKSFKPVCLVSSSARLTAPDAIVCSDPAFAAAALAALHERQRAADARLPEPLGQAPEADWEAAAAVALELTRNRRRGQQEDHCARLLAAAGIPWTPGLLVRKPEEAAEAARRFGGQVLLRLPCGAAAASQGCVEAGLEGDAAVTAAFAKLQGLHAGKFAGERFEGLRIAPWPAMSLAAWFRLLVRRDADYGAWLSVDGGRSLPLAAAPQRILAYLEGVPAAARLRPAALSRLADVIAKAGKLMACAPAVSELVIDGLEVRDEGLRIVEAAVTVLASGWQDGPKLVLLPATAPSAACSTRKGPVVIRPVEPEDLPALKAMLARISETSAFMRFHQKAGAIADEELLAATQIDWRREAAFVAVKDKDLCGVARFVLSAEGHEAEFGILVEDAMQASGLGSILMSRLEAEAARRGLDILVGNVLKENAPMIALMKKRGYIQGPGQDDDMVAFALALPEQARPPQT
ncbi:MAG: GNAT family N-acetyltransferase [Duodenibacillus sp.]|nr:GNAT family N-acetyltransferase [Duodenibacillus sp.]